MQWQDRSRVETQLRTFALHGGLTLAMAAGIAAGCSGADTSGASESVESESDPLTATISGTVTDSVGRPLSGVVVALNGAEQARVTTGITGTFSFPINVPGARASFSIQPTRGGCTFNPSAVNLNGITGNRTDNFTGTGAACVGVAQATAVDPGPRGGPRGAGTPVGHDAQSDDPAAQAAVAALVSPACPAALLLASRPSFASRRSTPSPERFPAKTASASGRPSTAMAARCAMRSPAARQQPRPEQPAEPHPQPADRARDLDGATTPFPRSSRRRSRARGAVRRIATEPTAAFMGSSPSPAAATRWVATRRSRISRRQLAANNVSFRIPTPTFGSGLVENITDAALQANLAASSEHALLGIAGVSQTTGNDGTVTRFGWKAQNKSLLIFAGEAYNVEQGVSNEISRTSAEAARVTSPVASTSTPRRKTTPIRTAIGGTSSDMHSDVVNFVSRCVSASRRPRSRARSPIGSTTITAAEIATGQSEFTAIGCANCHSPTLTIRSLPSIRR